MIAKLIEWSLRNQVMVVIATVLAVMGGIWSVRTIQVDAIPDLSDVQVIVYTEYPGQAPQVVEDQVSYPITTTMLSVPHAKTVRGYSYFGFSFVYVIFDDGTDLYWARSRVLEYLNGLGRRPPGWGHPETGTRRHRGRLGLHVRAQLPHPPARRAAFPAGLVSPIRPHVGGGGVGGGVAGRLCPPVPDRGRPHQNARPSRSPSAGSRPRFKDPTARSAAGWSKPENASS